MLSQPKLATAAPIVPVRKIIHLDMDAFFASVEQRDNPTYRGKPLVVGGDPNGRGVVAAASYEVRAYGVRSAMSCYQAKKRCPEVIFVRPRFEVYRAVSSEIRAIMSELTDLIEPLSLDEAYLDVTHPKPPHDALHKGSATLMANWLRQQIYQQTGLTASAGVSYNKMLAKIASDINKPNGIAVIAPDEAHAFIASLPIERFHGIGKATAKRLHGMGISTGTDLRDMPVERLIAAFGKRGKFYHDIAHGRDSREVKPTRERKSVGSETTFKENLSDTAAILDKIFEQNADAFEALTKRGMVAKTVTLKIKYSDFSQITRAHTTSQPFSKVNAAHPWLKKLLEASPRRLPIRLVGVTYSGLLLDDVQASIEQMNLFG